MGILNNLIHPEYLLLIIPLVLGTIWILKKRFVDLKNEEKEVKVHRAKVKSLVFITRITAFILLIIGLAGPFISDHEFIQGDPRVKILIDDSQSFSIFDKKEVNDFIKKVEDYIPVEQASIAFGDKSPIGDGILNNLKEQENILLISDGHNNFGSDLTDVGIYAASINSTVSYLDLKPKETDYSIRIEGPEKTTANVENTFKILIDKAGKKDPLKVILKIDDTTKFEKETDEDEIQFDQSFTSGYHKIEASIAEEDHFKENNIFYKTIKVVPKPKVALITERKTDLETLLSPLYDLSTFSAIPNDLSPYTSIIVNDIKAETLRPYTSELTNFVAEGNGMAVVGGQNSYDLSDYKGSLFEQILPVYVAQAGRKEGNNNIVIIIDISKSTSAKFGEDSVVDVEKAIALDILKGINPMSNVGVLAFNTQYYVVGEMKSLAEHSQELVDKISKLRDIGGTRIYVALPIATEMLKNQAGSKNIILITDGKTEGYDETLAATHRAEQAGIRVFTVGLGKMPNVDLLKLVSELGNGAFYKPEERQGLEVLFGDPKKAKRNSEGGFNIAVVNKNHFITEDLETKGTVFGFNTVVPKSSAKLLITTDTGDPILSVWRYGLGRVASISTDDGTQYAASLLNKGNSKLWTRIVNWANGDPERKNPTYVSIQDARLNEPTIIEVKSPTVPSSEEFSFTKIQEEIYQTNLIPDKVGFDTKLGALYATNNKKELERVGLSPVLDELAGMTDGRSFKTEDVEKIVEFMKTKSTRIVFKQKSYAWLFAILAAIAFLIEVCIRRIYSNKELLKIFRKEN